VEILIGEIVAACHVDVPDDPVAARTLAAVISVICRRRRPTG